MFLNVIFIFESFLPEIMQYDGRFHRQRFNGVLAILYLTWNIKKLQIHILIDYKYSI